MDTNKKILAYLLNRLRDRSADVRLKSIQDLVQLADPDSLEALQDTYRTDPDPDVRKAALEAGRTIFVKAKKGE